MRNNKKSINMVADKRGTIEHGITPKIPPVKKEQPAKKVKKDGKRK